MEIPPPQQVINEEKTTNGLDMELMALKFKEWVGICPQKRAVLFVSTEIAEDDKAINNGMIGGVGSVIIHAIKTAIKQDKQFEKIMLHAVRDCCLDKILKGDV